MTELYFIIYVLHKFFQYLVEFSTGLVIRYQLILMINMLVAVFFQFLLFLFVLNLSEMEKHEWETELYHTDDILYRGMDLRFETTNLPGGPFSCRLSAKSSVRLIDGYTKRVYADNTARLLTKQADISGLND